MSRLTVRMSPVIDSVGVSMTRSSIASRRSSSSLDLGPIVIDHGVDDAMQERDRAFAEHVLRARADLADMRDAAPLAVVDGDEEVRRQEEVGFVRLEAVLLDVEVDPVKHDVEVPPVRLRPSDWSRVERPLRRRARAGRRRRAERRRRLRSVPRHPPTPRRRCQATATPGRGGRPARSDRLCGRSSESIADLDAQCRLRRREARDRHAIGRAAHVVEAHRVEEVNRRGIAAVFTADPELDVLARRRPFFTAISTSWPVP